MTKKYLLPLWIFLLTLLPSQITKALSPPTIYSKTGIVIEAQTGKVLFQKNPDTPLDPASMTKVMTAYIVFEEIQNQNLSLDTVLTVSAKNAALSTGNTYFPGYVTMKANAEVTVDQLLQMIFVFSASAPCVILAEHISGTEEAFVQRMNQTAQRLSMSTVYQNCHGVSNNTLTPRDQARLIQVFVEQFPQVYDYTTQTSFQYNNRFYGTYTHFLLKESSYYDPTVTGFKIGANRTSETCLSTTVTRDGVTLIVVTFYATRNGYAFNDHQALIQYGYEVWNNQSAPYEDMADCPETQHIYEAFLDLGVNLQSINGWVRPTDPITLGEFSLTLVTALENLALLEKTTPNPLPHVWDIANYGYKDQLLRGIAYGILPTAPDGSFSPHVTMPREDIQTIFQLVQEVLPLPERDDPEYSPEVTPEDNQIPPDTTEAPQSLPVENLVLPTLAPNSYPVQVQTLSAPTYITRHDALLEILAFLQGYGVLEELQVA